MGALDIAWTTPALQEVTAHIERLADFDPQASERWYKGIVEAVEQAARFPLSGRVVPELMRLDVREVIVGSFRVIYRVTESHVVVWSVWHGRRLLGESVAADEPE